MLLEQAVAFCARLITRLNQLGAKIRSSSNPGHEEPPTEACAASPTTRRRFLSNPTITRAATASARTRSQPIDHRPPTHDRTGHLHRTSRHPRTGASCSAIPWLSSSGDSARARTAPFPRFRLVQPRHPSIESLLWPGCGGVSIVASGAAIHRLPLPDAADPNSRSSTSEPGRRPRSS